MSESSWAKRLENKITTNELVEFWNTTVDYSSAPYYSTEDSNIRKVCNCNAANYENLLTMNPDSKEMHLSLLPAPYCGDLENAKIYILSLNPGFAVTDYYEEEKCEKYRSEIIRNIKQEKTQYMNYCFNPEFLWTGGARYWTNKFKQITKELIEKEVHNNLFEVLQNLSNRIATLELIPYHSQKYNLPKKIEESLCSKKLIKKFVHDTLVPKAKKGETLIIVARKAKEWGFGKSDNKNIIIYGKEEAQSFSLSKKSKEEIIDFLTK
ncbi:hypothetical protein [Treponema sp.]|uniref:hypothetical protein n=1 Tax=Treponema sp. TaxID=166 RepID=UPI0025CF8D2D|nr:hypothetical protein [Treponema sp.]MBR4321204.1 hypothetical protein [Treponema sp.]